MSVRDVTLELFRRNVESHTKALELLERGVITTGERRGDGDWVDTTQRHIEDNKKAIAEYQRVIGVVEAGDTKGNG